MAHGALAQALGEPGDRDKFLPLVPPMLACLAATLNAGDEASAREALKMLIDGEAVPAELPAPGYCGAVQK